MTRRPNPRLQRTRSASPPSPLSRQPLGDRSRKSLAGLIAVCMAILSASCAASGTLPGCKNMVAPKLMSSVNPKIPEGFWKSHKDGVVVVETTIAADGSVSVDRVVNSTGHEYTVLALEAIRQWRYSPLLCDGVATPMTLSVNLHFSSETK
jgi:TonB family protein